jgi:hypothetical protein
MKRSLLLLPLLLLLAGCGRTYTLIGRVVFLDASASSITEVVGNAVPSIGVPISGAKITLFHELDGNFPKRDSDWSTSVITDKNGNFRLSDYATPGKKNLVGLEVAVSGYETVFITYYDYADPDEQYFLVVLRKQV